MNFYCRLMTTIWKCQLYIIARHKASSFGKIRHDLPNLIFFLKSMESEKFPFQLFLTTCKIALLPQNITSTEKYLWRTIHSYCHSNFKIHKWKLRRFKVMCIYRRSFPTFKQWLLLFVLILFSEWFEC